jgi:Xaa-Pro aminopeptidase
VSAIREAFALALLGQRAVAEAAVPGVREIELFGIAHAAPQLKAARPLGFVCDLVSGPRTGAGFGPVNVAGGRRLENRDVVVADVAVGSAFWGDSARTVIVGEADGELAAARAEIQEILDRVAATLTPGTPCAEVYRWVRSAISERLPGWSFPHHAGHGVGAAVFEDPHLIPADDTRLEPGMVLAIEPGAYLPGRFGVRIEDMFVVGERGGIRLTA